jgi:hypothetical protein
VIPDLGDWGAGDKNTRREGTEHAESLALS